MQMSIVSRYSSADPTGIADGTVMVVWLQPRILQQLGSTATSGGLANHLDRDSRGLAVLLGILVFWASIPIAVVLLVAMISVHLR
jgi:hypothetical protein